MTVGVRKLTWPSLVAVIVTGLALHLAAWFFFPPERALIAAPPALLANLYVSSAVTTFGMIALIVAFPGMAMWLPNLLN